MRRLFLLLTLISLTASAKDFSFMFQDYPPFNYEENGVKKGGVYDLVVAACKAQNIKCTFSIAPVVRGLAQVQDGSADGFLSITPSRERAEFAFFGPPMATTNFAYFGVKGSKKLKKLTDLSGYQVGALRGSSSLKMAQSHTASVDKLSIVEDTDIQMMLKKLSGGRYGEKGAVFGGQAPLEFNAKKLNIEIEPIFITEAQQFVIGFSRQSIDAESLKKFIDTLNAMKKSGEMAAIFKPYGLPLAP